MASLPDDRLYWRLTDLAKLTGIHRKALYRMTQTGTLAHMTLGDGERETLYIPREAVATLLSRLAADTDWGQDAAPENVRVRPLPEPARDRRAS